MPNIEFTLRSDTTANCQAATPAAGELGYDNQRKALFIGDGSTLGGLCVTPFTGAWTPQLNFGGAAVGMTGTFGGQWDQCGPRLNFSFQITLSLIGSSTGAATITGLPIVSAAGVGGAVSINYWGAMNTSPAWACFVMAGTSTISLGKSGATTWTALANTDFTGTSVLNGFGSMPTAWPPG